MKNLFFNFTRLIRVTVTFFLIITCYTTTAQHIQYRDKAKPVENKPPAPEAKTVPVAKPVVVAEDTSSAVKSRKAFTLNPRRKKPYVEEQNMCDLMSKPEVSPQLPLVINKVSPEMVKTLKERYAGHLYSITGLNMIDQRLKYKLKICDKNLGKFRSEYLDRDGNVVNDPDLDYE